MNDATITITISEHERQILSYLLTAERMVLDKLSRENHGDPTPLRDQRKRDVCRLLEKLGGEYV